jgi:hypothetical protein
MSTEKEVKAKEKFDEIKARMTKLAKENPSGQSATERRLILGGINALKKLITSGASNNLKEKIRNLKEKLENKKTQKPDITKRAMGGSMGGGMNPMGRSKDPTVESIVGYNPNKPNKMKKGGFPDMTGDGKVTQADILKGRGVFKRGGMAKGSREGSVINTRTAFKKGGAIKRRGGGIAKRGFGIAK